MAGVTTAGRIPAIVREQAGIKYTQVSQALATGTIIYPGAIPR